jgi:hypothetical protein
LDDRDTFERLQATAAAFLAAHPDAAKALLERRDGLRDREFPLFERRKHLTAERTSLAGRTGRVPKYLDDLRHQVAEAAGIDAADLPFLAELIDIAAGQHRWRTAVETVLGASARLLLVPHDRFEAFSAAIDPLRLRGRLTFEGVPHGLDRPGETDPDTIAGKLLFKNSPCTGWVRRHVGDPARNALCVETPDHLTGPGLSLSEFPDRPGLNFAGSANVLAAVAVLLAAPTVWRLRSPAAAALVTRPIVLAFLLSYALVGPIKLWTDRAAPTSPSWNAAGLFTHADGWSFPSGHVVNAIIWYRVLLFLLDTALRAHGRPPLGARPRRVLRLAPPIAVCCTVTYLN